MNILKNRMVHPHLRDEEALVIENAVSLAIDSIINVLYSVTSARTHEYQRMVADRDKEIQRLESRSKVIEYELQELRQQGCTCRLFGNEHNHTSDAQRGDETFQPVGADNEITTEQECEMSISLGLFTRPPSEVSIQSQRSAPTLSPSTVGFEQTFASNSTVVSGVSDGARSLSTSPATLKVKEEPSDIDTVLIEWEVSDQSIGEHQEAIGTLCDPVSPCTNRRLDNRERIRKLTEKLYADSDRQCVQRDGQRPRNGKKSAPMSEMPEEAQRLKRAAWRAASRRYYARKVARLRGGSTQTCAPMPLNPVPSYSLCPSFGQKRVKTVISEIPVDTQTLPREAWRVSSGSYAQKMSRVHAERTQPTPFLQDTAASESAGLCTGQPHDNTPGLGGIICS